MPISSGPLKPFRWKRLITLTSIIGGCAGAIAGIGKVITDWPSIRDSLFPPVPQLSASNTLNTDGRHCLDVAFKNLPTHFTLGKVVFKFERVAGVQKYSAEQVAEIKTVRPDPKSEIINVDDLLENETHPDNIKPIIIDKPIQSERNRDLFITRFCPIIRQEGWRGSVSFRLLMYDIDGKEFTNIRGRDAVQRQELDVSHPKNYQIAEIGG